MQFEVIKTNIMNFAVDAIVLPANEYLKEGSGTSHAIYEATGRKTLTIACEKIGYCSVGKYRTIVASSVQVAPERILLVGANPQSPKIIPALRDGCAFCENA